jgi:dephospho-CoA kinase
MKKLKIGITGGIGSGKTTVCKIFETLGIPVYYSDERARALYLENDTLRAGAIALFGSKAYLENGEFNRKLVADEAFKNPEILKKLNALVHPAVFKDGNEWHDRQTDVPYTLKEAALLFESGGDKFLDKIITVYAPKELRIERVILRGGGIMTREDVEARIAKQMSDEEKKDRADYVIFNDGNHALIPQVLAIHHKILEEISESKVV